MTSRTAGWSTLHQIYYNGTSGIAKEKFHVRDLIWEQRLESQEISMEDGPHHQQLSSKWWPCHEGANKDLEWRVRQAHQQVVSYSIKPGVGNRVPTIKFTETKPLCRVPNTSYSWTLFHCSLGPNFRTGAEWFAFCYLFHFYFFFLFCILLIFGPK